MSEILVICGSARSDGDTIEALNDVFDNNLLDNDKLLIINLIEKNISPYNYDNQYINDDFSEISLKMSEAEKIVFATPVYWYSMSGIMKNFFDRFTDLITVNKALGRSLSGKKCYLLACGAATSIPESFEKPFSGTCEYFAMDYCGDFYYSSGEGFDKQKQSADAVDFGNKILA